MSFTFNWVSTPGQNNNFVNGSINGGRARAFLDDGQVDPFDSPLYICIPPITFQGGNSGAATLLDFARTIATCGVFSRVQQPGLNYNGNRISTGGTFTLNGNPCGNYEYNVLEGGTTLTQASIATLFSSTNDVSSWIVCKGNLTIGAGAVLIPTVNPTYTAPSKITYATPPDPDAKRRLFMVVYVTGNLIFGNNDSTISMSACGGNTSSTGANIGTFNVPIANNIYYYTGTPPATSASPTIQSVGGAGGASVSSPANGQPGGSGAALANFNLLYTAGGGSGKQNGSPDGSWFSGAGGSGSAFSGGAGGGAAARSAGATAGSSLGGAGGTSSPSAGSAAGGTGNPGGTGNTGTNGLDGTGGVVIIICEGSYIAPEIGDGKIYANGVSNNSIGSGGASGAGLIAFIQSSSAAAAPVLESSGGVATGSAGSGGNGPTFKYGITNNI